MFKSIHTALTPALCTLLGAGTLAAVLFVQASQEAERVRLHTELMARQALAQAGYRWARFEIDDAVGRVVGEAPDASSRDAALRTARRVLAPAMAWPGVFTSLQDGTRLAAPQAMAHPPREVVAARGAVPLPASLPLSHAADRCRGGIEAVLKGQRIRFELGSARLTAESRGLLPAVADLARACPAAQLAVEGHTDASGLADRNLRLSQQRAQAVVAALIEAGVPADRLRFVGLGSSRPLAQGDDASARAQNRRIEFHWTAPTIA